MAFTRASLYYDLASQFLAGELSLQQLWEKYNLFYQEENTIPNDYFDVLDSMWAAIELADEDPAVYLSPAGGYLSVDQLREELTLDLARLKDLMQRSAAQAESFKGNP